MRLVWNEQLLHTGRADGMLGLAPGFQALYHLSSDEEADWGLIAEVVGGVGGQACWVWKDVGGKDS